MRTLTTTLYSGLAALCLLTPAAHSATTVATVPEGYITVTISAGTGATPTLSIISLPLLDTSTASGQQSGVITSVAAKSITNGNAGWTIGQLSTVTTPFIIRITSGTAIGRTFLASTTTNNTATTVTLDANETSDLTTLGIVAGTDTYELIPCDTIASVFGTPATTGVLDNANPALADQVMILVNGTWRKYYYNTTLSDWRMVGLNSPSSNVALTPNTAIVYSRLAASALPITITGRIPITKRIASISTTGLTGISTGWPTSVTLLNSGINQTSGWVSNTDPNIADFVLIMSNGTWKKYYHDGTMWRMVGLNSPSDTVAIPVGGGAVIQKKGSTTGTAILTQNLPYTLE